MTHKLYLSASSGMDVVSYGMILIGFPFSSARALCHSSVLEESRAKTKAPSRLRYADIARRCNAVRVASPVAIITLFELLFNA